MRPLTSRRSPPSAIVQSSSISPAQWAWAILGFAVLLLIAVIAATNLTEIYDAQKDFVAGSLFSLVGFAFGKALSQTQEQHALNVLRAGETPRLRAVLRDETRRQLHYNGVFAALARAERLVETSSERVHQFLDEPQDEAECVDFYRERLGDSLAMFDDAAIHLSQLRDRLESTIETPAREEIWTTLAAITSRVGRANLRRVELKQQLWVSGREMEADSLAILAVIGADVLAARRILTALSGSQNLDSLAEHLSVVADFLAASLERAAVLRANIESALGRVPLLFDVMTDDLRKAQDGVTQLRLLTDDTARETRG